MEPAQFVISQGRVMLTASSRRSIEALSAVRALRATRWQLTGDR
jgi:hypothetical protein